MRAPDSRVPSHSSDPFAWDLVQRVASLYGSCRTYQDTGEATRTIRWEEPAQVRKCCARFKTAFVRPDRFLFENRSLPDDADPKGPTDVLWTDASGASRAWSVFGTRFFGESSSEPSMRKTLVRDIAALVSVSLGASTFVPWLLRLADPCPSPLPNPLTARSLGVAEHDGRLCDRIEDMRRAERIVVWVERGTDHVLKVASIETFDDAYYDRFVQEYRQALSSMPPEDPTRPSLEKILGDVRRDNFRSEKTILLRPTLDRPVDPAIFDFRPPTGS